MCVCVRLHKFIHVNGNVLRIIKLSLYIYVDTFWCVVVFAYAFACHLSSYFNVLYWPDLIKCVVSYVWNTEIDHHFFFSSSSSVLFYFPICILHLRFAKCVCVFVHVERSYANFECRQNQYSFMKKKREKEREKMVEKKFLS